MKNIMIPTGLTFLSKCALELGMQVADKARSHVEVVSVVETAGGNYLAGSGEFSQDPLTPIYNAKLTEMEREKTRERVEELQYWFPELAIKPKILFGKERVETLLDEIYEKKPDLVIIGGDRYVPDDIDINKFIRNATCPVLTVKCKLDNLDLYRDIIFLADLERDDKGMMHGLLALQLLLNAKVHILRVNTPDNFLSTEKSMDALKEYMKVYPLENVELITNDAESEHQGLLAYSQKFDHAFIAIAMHERTFIQRMLSQQPEGEVIANSIHPIWTYGG